MVVNPIHTSPARCAASSVIYWHYLPLREITYLQDQPSPTARVLVEDDQGGTLHSFLCAGSDLAVLEPYSNLLAEQARDPFACEAPVIPVIYSSSGRPELCRSGAEYDFPELRPINRKSITLQLDTVTKERLRELALHRGMSQAELVFTALLKQSSKSG